MPSLRITFYLEVLSSWCHWAEPTWATLREKYAGVAQFSWKIALMPTEAFPQSREQCEWFYQRSGTIRRSPYRLNAGWFETGQGQYLPPNLMALAAKHHGIDDDSVRLALSRAALLEGKKAARWEVAAAVAAEASGLSAGKLLETAQSAEILALAQAQTAEFEQLQITQRPAFVIENGIGDKAVFSGLVQVEPLIATIEAMLADEAAYRSYAAHFTSCS